jgi:hypothetical protein
MESAPSCLSFAVDCGTLAKGAGVMIAAFVLFVGSVWVLLAAVFGRYLGYLVLAVAFFGWMIIQSALWLFGFWAQGPDTPTNLGPRGSEAAWVVASAGLTAANDTSETFAAYPAAPWEPADLTDPEEAADIQSVQSAATDFLAEQANHELGMTSEDLSALTPTQFSVRSTAFATSDDGTPLAVVTAFYTGGGPQTTVSMYYDGGTVPRYSWMFLIGSTLLFGLHLPLLDRAERKRKEFLTGGTAPPWYGPA